MKNIISKNKIILGTALLALAFVFGANTASAQILAPTISTSNASASQTSAVLKGYYVANGSNTYVSFVWGTSSTALSNYTSYVSMGTGSGAFNEAISGLSANTTYYFRAEGYNSIGFNNGSVNSFTTSGAQNLAPTITTSNASASQTSATLNGSYFANGSNTYVRFAWGTSSSNLNNYTAYIYRGTGSGSFSQAISGLTAGTTYYFQAEGYNSNDSDYGSVNSFTTSAVVQNLAPTISTNNATSIAQESAILNGIFNANSSDTYTRFAYGTSSTALNSFTSYVLVGTGSGSTSQTISGLSANTIYYFRAEGYNSNGSNNGSVNSFTTSGAQNFAPIISTDNATSIAQASAILNGIFNANSSDTYTRFAYGTSSTNLNSLTTYVPKGAGSGSFSQAISGLMAGTTYYFQAEGYNSNDSDYGSVNSFTTIAQDNNNSGQYPTAVTKFATNVGNTSATLNGQVINNYNLAVTAWFEYGTDLSVITNKTAVQSIGAGGTANFNARLTNLSANNIYYFRAVTENAGGQSKGEILVFKTSKASGSGSGTGSGSGSTSNPVSSSSSAAKPIVLQIETSSEKLLIGESVDYIVTYKNEGDKAVTDLVVKVTLPKQVIFERSSDGAFSTADNTLTLSVSNLAAKETRTLFIQGRVANDAKDGDSALVVVSAKYTDPSTKKAEEAITYIVGQIVSAQHGNQLVAAALFGSNSFLPNTLFEWLLLVLVIGGLVFFGRKWYIDAHKKKGIPNLPGAMIK